VHTELVPEGKTVNAEFYKGETDRLKRIQRVRPAAFCSRDTFFLHDNAPTHKAASVCQLLSQKNVNNPLSPPPPRTPPDYFLVPKLKMKLKRLHFADVADIQKAVNDELKKVERGNCLQLFKNSTTAQKPTLVKVYRCETLSNHVMSIYFLNLDRNNGIKIKA